MLGRVRSREPCTVGDAVPATSRGATSSVARRPKRERGYRVNC